MTERGTCVTGAPCWVDTLQPDPQAAARFYGPLFGWEFDASGPDGYLAARLRGRLVSGIAPSPAGAAVWGTYVRVDDVAAAIARAVDAGGTALFGPVVADPSGIAFALTED